MGILRKTFALAGWGGLAAAGTYVTWSRKCSIESIPPSDYLFHSTLFARYNPSKTPVTQDVCKRKVPLQNIKPELLEKEGRLTEAFCAGVWSGLGYTVQRKYLERKYRGPNTATDLWERKELRESTYDVGTIVTDHFLVLAKTPDSIVVRCGDSPRKTEVRQFDGLFEITTEIKQEEGVAEFQLKGIFFNGLAEPDAAPPLGPSMQWLHQQYSKILLESALPNVTKGVRA